LLPSVLAGLERNGFLRIGSHVYVEAETAPEASALPANWRLHRQQHAGQVCYSLFIRDDA
jgi:16S rRNA (guanine966-N2)-methyltransferase